ncbi:nucleotide sugar dehydrogenase [Halosegnis rubeus]|uniref:UDP-N-acetyl-D-mannosamine dehydrogenase n=1 Tax=Halosegnis rubeus TaxID=2212850 RepID=A0A5N5UIC8_9EURY|nr:nucleotide sugar dehydrogenase [Halosegnis rubeus]KAB7518010.1 nucleotide sugar dehydrogenase [Halosegnis rubeus]
MKVAVVGLGHIGLPTALLLARRHEVVGVDVDESLVATLNDGELPLDEPGLDSLHDEVAERFTAATEPEPADAYVITVPTPLDQRENVADLGFVRAAVESVAEVVSAGELVVLESTVPPGTSERLVQPILADAADDVRYAHCPERAIPERTLEEMTANDRVVGTDERATETIRDLYAFTDGELHLTDPTTAEFVKLAENTSRDVGIALANEFATLAEGIGVDAHEAIDIANEHPRVDILNPGPGVGGHCITTDPWFLTGADAQARLVPLARDINDGMPDHVLGLVREQVAHVRRPRVAVLGVAYKRNVSDTRETPAGRFIRRAENDGYDVRVHDPHVEAYDEPLVDRETALEGADCAVVITDHDAFRELAPADFDGMRTRTVVDSRNILAHDTLREAGISVSVLGDGTQG